MSVQKSRYDPTWLVMAQAVDEVERVSPRLDVVEAQGVTAVLSHAVHRLSVMGCGGGAPDLGLWEDYAPLDARMTRLHKLEPPDQAESDHTRFVKKVRSVCSFIRHVLKVTAQELFFYRTKYYLEYVLHVDNAKNYDGIMLKAEYHDVKEQIHEFTRQLSTVKQNFDETSFYLSDHMIGPCLRKAVVNAWANAQTTMKHSDVSLQARISQKNYALREKEDLLHDQIDDHNLKMQEDSVVDVEVQGQLLTMITRLNHNLEKWTFRYNSEIEGLDVSLLQVKSKADAQHEEYTTLLGLYSARAEEVAELRAGAELREAEQEEKRRQHKAAAVIQTWWRALVMLRFVRAKRAFIGKSIGKKGSAKTGKKAKKK